MTTPIPLRDTDFLAATRRLSEVVDQSSDVDGGCHGTCDAGSAPSPASIPEGCEFLTIKEPELYCGDYPESCNQMREDDSRHGFQCWVEDDFRDADGGFVQLSDGELAERAACVAAWLKALGADDVTTGYHLVEAMGTWSEVGPLTGVATLDCSPNCEKGTCDYCYDLDEAGCARDGFCVPGYGIPIDVEAGCTEASRFAICRQIGLDSDYAKTMALDASGQCWYFSSFYDDKGFTYNPAVPECNNNYPECVRK